MCNGPEFGKDGIKSLLFCLYLLGPKINGAKNTPIAGKSYAAIHHL